MKRVGRQLRSIVFSVGCLAAAGAVAAEPNTATINAYAKEIQPLLARYCLKCHSGEEPEGGFPLDRYSDGAAAVEQREPWEKVAAKLQAREMPPEDQPQPAADEIQQITAWIDNAFGKLDCTGQHDPGRVTIRRLNRAEYNNTIRDLVGVDFRPADDFPSDDVGYGFDNIGDVLSLPPILLEKYMAAAETIVDKAIVTSPPATVQSRVEAEKMTSTGLTAVEKGVSRLLNSGELKGDLTVPAEGEYILRVRAYGEQAGPEIARMAIRIDDREVAKLDVPAREAEPAVYEVRTKLSPGLRKLSVAFVNDYWRPLGGDDAGDRNLAVDYVELATSVTFESLPETHRRIFLRDPSGEDKDTLAREILERFASRAFRRPVRGEEINRLLTLVHLAEQQGDSFEAGIKLAVQAILVSPHFLFRIEADRRGRDRNAIRELTDFELATRLSYFLWSSMPDDELFALAQEEKLRKDGNLEAQVRRMLRDGKSRALVDNFAGQWLQTRRLSTMTPDPELFPSFSDELRAAMLRETELFFATIVEEDRSILDFLDADFTFLNERLARHYGIPGVEGNDFRRVKLSGDQRGGVLSQASILTITSNPTRTSPVKRGKWVLENILGTPPPPPPPGVPELSDEEEVVLSGSLRERMEQHRTNPTCASCHSRMDPLGFGLENYDAIGAWRQRDGKFDVDASGVLPGGESFSGPRELRLLLKSKQDQFARCLAEKVLTYALGRGLEFYDRCAVDEIVAAVEQNDYKFSSMVIAVVQSEPFQKRRGKGEDR